jgi:iron complex outermembrane receptor protein
MYQRKRLANSITMALATSAGVLSGAVVAAENVLEEVTVTATKRVENLQDVPFAVSALGQEKLDELNIANFDDYIRYLPGVNSAGRGPGQSSIFIRGMATDSSDQTSIEIGAPVPNVALYLDEQPVSSGGRNLDLYAADIARVEVLPGPQGTLFGASSMAGTIRLITNKPVYNEFHSGFKASVATTKSGDLSNSVEAYINWPLIDDRMAIRGVFYNAVEGGYIDNVYGENAYTADDVGFPEAPNPPSSTTCSLLKQTSTMRSIPAVASASVTRSTMTGNCSVNTCSRPWTSTVCSIIRRNPSRTSRTFNPAAVWSVTYRFSAFSRTGSTMSFSNSR